MSTSAIRLIQAAVYALLNGDATLLGLVEGVFNDVPDSTAYPHVLIGNAHETPWDTFGTATTGRGKRVLLRVHIYSQYQGDLEALQILDRVVMLLDNQTLTVTGYGTVLTTYHQGRVLIEDVEKVETRHIPAEFLVWVHQ